MCDENKNINFFVLFVEEVLVSNSMAPSCRHQNLMEQARALRTFINRCSSHRLDRTEFACLKALALFIPGMD